MSRNDVNIQQMGGTPLRYAALVAGRVKVAPLQEPISTAARKAGFHPILDLAAEDIPWIFDGLVVTNENLKSRKDDLTRFTQAYIEAAYIAFSDPTRAKQVISKVFKTSDQTVIDAGYNAFRKLWPQDAEPPRAGAENLISRLAATGVSIANKDPNAYIDTSIIEDLRKKGFYKDLASKYGVK